MNMLRAKLVRWQKASTGIKEATSYRTETLTLTLQTLLKSGKISGQ